MITLDPNKISEIDEATMGQRRKEQMQIFVSGTIYRAKIIKWTVIMQ